MNLSLSGRFGLLELIAVVTLVGVLAAQGIKYYGQAIDDARETGTAIQARNFTSVVAMIHWSWVTKGDNYLAAIGNRDAAIRVDNTAIYVNRHGWPTHTDASLSRQALSAEGCNQVWQAAMQNPGSSGVKTGAKAAGGQLQVSVVEGHICRYELPAPDGVRRYFDYDVTNGRIDLVTGR